MLIRSDFPGAELVSRGLDDLQNRRTTAEAYAVAAARTRLRSFGFDVPDLELDGFPEHALYDVLTEALGQAAGYARYNAILAELHSFIQTVGPFARAGVLSTES